MAKVQAAREQPIDRAASVRKVSRGGRKRTSSKPATSKREGGGIQSVERAVAILEIIGQCPEGINLSELSARLGLNNSTVFHLVKTLDKLDFVFQVPETKRYFVGSHLFRLAAGALHETTLLSLATPILEQLSRDTGEAAHLVVRSQNQSVVIARTAATGMLQLSGHTGTTRPAHATAHGKVLLAEMQQPELDRLLESYPLQALTANTVTDHETLFAELEEIRQKKIAYDKGEFDKDVNCAAVAVHDFAGRCAGAIGISGPIWRMTPKLMKKKVKSLQNAGVQLSSQLGFAQGRSEN